MLTLYNHGNKDVEFISTPESRLTGKEKPADKDLVQGLILLTVPLKNPIDKLIELGMKRYAAMDEIYMRKIAVNKKSFQDAVVRISLLDTDKEKQWVNHYEGDKKTKVFRERKHEYLKKESLVDIRPEDMIKPNAKLKRELDKIPGLLKEVLSGKRDISKKTLSPGIPYLRLTLRSPLPVEDNLVIKVYSKSSEEDKPIYSLL